jgi:plasmid maintenance system killer protein
MVFSFDLRTQVHAATLYSCGTAPEDGVLLFYADFDANRLVTLAKAAKDAQNTTYNNHVVYSWIDEKKPAEAGKKPRVYASIAGARVVFGQRQDRVGQALDVLDRTAPSLASSANFPLVGVVGDNSFVEAAARRLDMAGAAPNARVLRLSKSVLFQVTEAQQQFTATFSLEANNPEVAGNIHSIAQGLVALMKLQTDQPEALKLANAIAVAQNGAQITSTFSMPTPDLLQLVRAAQARKAARQPAGP